MKGTLAGWLRDASANKTLAERELEAVLIDLLPDFRARFPRNLSVIWSPPASLDVFEVEDSSTAVCGLWLHGFTSVTLHPHPASMRARCDCRSQEPSDTQPFERVVMS